ncbi:hypothetical protein E1218_11640 [Kribbella turkmenica]|uniref:Lipoprotein n=1 Tax=Kribbella turkmenica TaxID=2530375 RepID=A0A4R4X8Z6_9ACTN|nr:hypothetical protein [Kribbella turkmenica]TDD26981.1 hypothetical protein E1218_11640 [Kribbella turkmenica]
MSFPWIRTAAAVATIALVTTGCGAGADSAGENEPAVTTSATARPSTPAGTPATSPPATSLEDLPVRTIMRKTREASLKATNLRMRGSIDDTDGPMTFDIVLTEGGGEGTFTVAGASYSVRAIGRTVYLQLSESAIRAQAKADGSSQAETAQVLSMLKNKWIKLSKIDQDTQQMVDLVTPGRFFGTVFGQDDTATAALPRKVAARMVDGVRCVGLTDDGAALWIDIRTGRLIRMTEGKNRFTFSAYGKAPTPKAPAKSQVLDGKPMGL